jgi:hypothetical protein
MRHPMAWPGSRLWLPLSLAMLCCLGMAHADDVGIVAEYRPAAGRFSFERGVGEVVPVRIGTVVAAGDRLSLPAGAAVIVQDGSGQRRELAGPGTFEIPASRPLGRLASIYRSMTAVFDDEYRLAGTAASRSGEDCRAGAETRAIHVPILAGQPAIVAGERDLPLAWVGGCTPFTVSVLGADGTVLHRSSVDARRVRLDRVQLATGRYEILVEDADGLAFRARLEAMPAAPAMPPEIAEDLSPLGVVAGAIWLAEQDGGRWRFDSFERLRPMIRAGDPLAGAIGDGVLWGEYSR